MKCLGQFVSIAAAISASPLPRADVAIIDWRLEDGTGNELLLQLAPMLGPLHWLLCTATPTAYVVKEAIAAGVRGCVSKSCDVDELAQAMEALASGETYFCNASQRAMMTSLTSGLHRLTATEVSILQLVARGLEPKSIAAELGLADKTIYNNLGVIRDRLKPQLASGSLVDLARFARQQGISVGE